MPSLTCYYDGACGLCQGAVRRLRALDWLGRLEFQDLTALSDAELPVDRSAALRGMPARTAGGRVLVGFPAVRLALRQTPLGFPLALALHVPGVSHLADRVYRFIAARRARDVTSCALPGAPASGTRIE